MHSKKEDVNNHDLLVHCINILTRAAYMTCFHWRSARPGMVVLMWNQLDQSAVPPTNNTAYSSAGLMSVCYYFLHLLRDYKGDNDAF